MAESEARGSGVARPPVASETLLDVPIPEVPLVLRESAVGLGLSVLACDLDPGRREGESLAVTVTSIKLGLVDRFGSMEVASGVEIVGVKTSVSLRTDRANSDVELRFLSTESIGAILVISDCCGRRVTLPAAAESSD